MYIEPAGVPQSRYVPENSWVCRGFDFGLAPSNRLLQLSCACGLAQLQLNKYSTFPILSWHSILEPVDPSVVYLHIPPDIFYALHQSWLNVSCLPTFLTY